MKLIFLDTETTGNESKDRLCQLAYKERDTGNTYSELFKPPLPISIESSAVCHITNKMVSEKSLFKESSDYQIVKSLLEEKNTVTIAHNAKFDVGILQREDIEPHAFVCTLRVARALDKNGVIPRYNLQYLRYYLDIEISATAHDALGDVLVLEQLFERLLKKIIDEDKTSEDEALKKMIDISSHPSLINKISFGKYNGRMVEEIAKEDPGYLTWLLKEKRKSDSDEEDWIFTLEMYLGK
ncbi:MAG: hypothetical protein KBB88_00150 [Candidatus Pacebacteria bacterium]|nr:hypothetical protein [Candidatus Paceibacterota bacterium]